MFALFVFTNSDHICVSFNNKPFLDIMRINMLEVNEVLDGGEGGGRVWCGGGGDRKGERYVAKNGEKGLLR
jgi:hypothetical protein